MKLKTTLTYTGSSAIEQEVTANLVQTYELTVPAALGEKLGKAVQLINMEHKDSGGSTIPYTPSEVVFLSISDESGAIYTYDNTNNGISFIKIENSSNTTDRITLDGPITLSELTSVKLTDLFPTTVFDKITAYNHTETETILTIVVGINA
jgi:hypothetical protein